MKIVVACDSFKGSLRAAEAVEHIAEGILRVWPEAQIERVPIADGGEGTMEILLDAVGGRKVEASVTGPLGDPVQAEFAILNNKTAVIEMAAASGLTLIEKERLNPLLTTTYGTGELIRNALELGCREIIIGIGGSSTNDGGAGMAQALGAHLLDASGREIPRGGGFLDRLETIDLSDLDSRLSDVKIMAACDVTNPLCGENGAACVYGPQKGASPGMIRILDWNLGHFARVAAEQLGRDVADIPGSGAAGGLGAGLLLFCGAQLSPGITVLLDVVDFDRKIADADLVVTGEGRIDGQSVCGKVPVGVARRVKRQKDIPVFAIVGGIGAGAARTYEEGIDSIFSMTPGPVSLAESMEQADRFLADAAERLMRAVRAVKGAGR